MESHCLPQVFGGSASLTTTHVHSLIFRSFMFSELEDAGLDDKVTSAWNINCSHDGL
jgi:hypothetical protein